MTFKQYTPPPGGLQRLRARISHEPRRLRWQLGLAMSVAIVVLIVAAALLQPRREIDPTWSRNLASLQAPVEAESLTVLNPGGATLRVPTQNSDVIFYWVDRVSGQARP